MAVEFKIHPAIGVARLGNSRTAFYLEPDGVGKRPIEANPADNTPGMAGQDFKRVNVFKENGEIKRQAAWFRLFKHENGDPIGQEITLDGGEITSIAWTVHIANKKAVWYNFSELEGNPLLPNNTYQEQNVGVRNSHVPPGDRQPLIIDPGPRTVVGGSQAAHFSRDTIPCGYPGHFPDPNVKYGDPINTLGEIRTDPHGRLLVLGGYGRSGGEVDISSFAGADTWHDDIADGLVKCTIEFGDGARKELTAWVIVGSPKYAPELVNTSTLADVMLDVAIREFNLNPDICENGVFKEDYRVNYDRDIAPIVNTPAQYRWVANVPSMMSFSPPNFDPRDASPGNAANRQAYYELFRNPGNDGFYGNGDTHKLFAENGIANVVNGTGLPLMPLNSGNNSVTNEILQKFLTLTETQFFFLKQWADGKFDTSTLPPAEASYGLSPLDIGSVGNCVGLPNCPGIEVTWNCWNKPIYSGPFEIKPAHYADENYYFVNGLSPTADECLPGSDGCEPGDLTKRMAIPWQADFFQCSIQYINFTDPKINKEDGIPKPPTYYAYWWPPQSPWNVITGDVDPDLQALSGLPAGQQALYSRGVNTFAQMIAAWSYLGFIVNVVDAPNRGLFPYFVELERNHARFEMVSVAVGPGTNILTSQSSPTYQPMWFLRPDAMGSHRKTGVSAQLPRAGGPRI